MARYFSFFLVIFSFIMQSPLAVAKGHEVLDWLVMDGANPGELLAKEHNGSFLRIKLDGLKVIGEYKDQCGLKSTVLERLEWASPVLVSIGKACMLDEPNGAMVKASGNTVPENASSVSYFGKSSTQRYFLVNARPWKTNGFIYLKTIDQAGNAGIRALVNDVPGYSGPMAVDAGGKYFLYTEATGAGSNRLHKIAVDALDALVKNGGTAKFPDLAQRVVDFPGLSLWLSVGTSQLLYGEEDTVYFLNRTNGKKSASKEVPDCKPVALPNDMIFLCGERDISVRPVSGLLQAGI